MGINILIFPMIVMWLEKLSLSLWYYIVCKSTYKVDLYHKVMMFIYVCTSTYVLNVHMKFPKHVLVQTQEKNQELECLQYIYCSLVCVWDYISNDILRRGWMGMVRTYW